MNVFKIILLFALIAVCSQNLQSQWTQQNSGTSVQLTSVFFTDALNGSICGVSGLILHTSNGGTNWVNQPNSTGVNLWGIYYLNLNTGIVAGDQIIARTTNGGTNWLNQVPPVPEYFNAVNFADANTGFIVGTNGSILRSTNSGSNWNVLTSGTNAFLHDVMFANSSTGFIVGFTGVILKTTNSGNNWVTQTSGTNVNLLSLAVIDSNTTYISGDIGVILKTTNGGNNWTPLVSGSTATLYAIYFSNSNTGTAVGYPSAIRRTTNGGTNWLGQDAGIGGNTMEGVHFTSVTTGYIAGENGKIFYTTTGGFILPSAPNLLLPVNGSSGVALAPLLKWDTVLYAKTYDVQLSTDTGFTSLAIDTTLLDSAQLQISAGRLQNNIHYYWRARAVNIVGNGPWSQVFSFTTIVAIPNAPVLLLPVNNASNVSLTPFFDWDSTSPALYYHLQASSDSTFATSEVDYTNILFSSFTLVAPPIQSNTRYYWRVSTINAAGTGPWSSVFRFTTIITIPQAPILVSPLNNSNGNPLTPTLDWRDDITATSYQLQLSADSLFNTTLTDTTGFNVSQITVRSGLLVNLVKYFWRVRTTNSLGTGPWSSVWNFRTGLTPPAFPILRAPLNGAVDVSTIVTLAWDSVAFADTYRVMISTDSTFNTYIISAGGLTLNHYTTSGGTLQNNTVYYWRVNATNNSGTGPWSAVWHFRTVIPAPLAAPDLLSPANGATVSTLTPILDWNDIVSASGYKVQVSTDSLFITPVLDTIVTPSQLTVPSGKLVGSTRYYWRARGTNAGGFGPWSVTWYFNTSAIGITTISTVIPKDFKLYDCYPNPFNPSTKIRFDIPKPSSVKITVYDLLGREITTLFQLFLRPGTYETTWIASSQASGIYFYRIDAKDFVQTRKMLLIK